MSYRDLILSLPSQFSYRPEIIHADRLPKNYSRIIVAGMGGSRLPADILNVERPDLELHIHSDYNLPHFTPNHIHNSFVIAQSHSGNTAETISAAEMALKAGLHLAIISAGGQLIELAQEHKVPHIILPAAKVVAREAVGYQIMALAKMLDLDMTELVLCGHLSAERNADEISEIVDHIGDAIPLVYVPDRYNELGYIWKIILNETAKIPAFSNRIPELTHNELESLVDGRMSQQFRCILLTDSADPKTVSTTNHLISVLTTHGIGSKKIDLAGETVIQKIINSLITAHWVGLAIADKNGRDPLATLVIESFKDGLI